MNITEIQQFQFLLLIALWAAAGMVIAYRLGFFKLKNEDGKWAEFINLGNILAVFIIFLSVQVVIYPLLIYLSGSLAGLDFTHPIHLSQTARSWINIGSMGMLAVCLSFYLLRLKTAAQFFFRCSISGMIFP